MGLGPYPEVSIEAARKEAAKRREQFAAHVNPIKARKNERLQQRIAEAKSITFKAFAQDYVDTHEIEWTKKHTDQWRNTLTMYAYPLIGDLPVSEIDADLVMKVLVQRDEDTDRPFWLAKPETATRLRGRLEKVLGAAIYQKRHAGPNPAQWKGHLSTSLPARSRLGRGHHPALPYAQVAAFMTDLAKQEGAAARALEFVILTASRTSEVLLATWDEFDLPAKMWTVPANRMKARREHRVPLSDRAIKLLQTIRGDRTEGYVFPGRQKGKPLSNMAMLAVLKRMKRDDLTSHGFRSTFRDWAAEKTNFPSHVAEMALAHSIPNATEAAYRRGDLFERRGQMMEAWAKYCFTPANPNATVIPFKSAANA